MTEQVTVNITQGIAFMRLGRLLTRAMMGALRDTLLEAENDPAVGQIVLIGADGHFPVGEEVSAMSSDNADLADLCDVIETCDTPVVAAVQGRINGGGMALALAAHARVAARETQVGFPEIRLDLLPSAGQSQRLPRLLGAKHSLSLLLTGDHVGVDDPKVRDLWDALCDGDIAQGAEQFCLHVQSSDVPLPHTRDRRDGFSDPRGFQAALAEWRKTDLTEIQQRCLELVEASALLPFGAGVAMERDAYEESAEAERSQALRYAHQITDSARDLGKEARSSSSAPQTIAVLGAVPLAIQIAASAIASGLTVQWGARDQEKLEDGFEQLRAFILSRITAAGWSPAEAHAKLARLKTGESADMVGGADFVIFAARGQWDIRLPPEAVRAQAIPGKLEGLGLRFPPPVFATRLVEVLIGPKATEQDRDAALALAGQLGKIPVLVKSQRDSVAGNLAQALQRAADALVDLGASPYEVDEAVTQWGWSRPPFQTRDLSGLNAAASAFQTSGSAETCGKNWSQLLSEQGRKGWVAGRGFYDWGDDGASPSAEVTALLDAARPPTEWRSADIRHLLIGAVANAGIKMINAGMVARAADIDLVSLLALDFPAAHGGVMKSVSQSGLFKVMKAMQAQDHLDQTVWSPDPAWMDLVKNGKDFDAI